MTIKKLHLYWVNMFCSWSFWLCLFLVTSFFCPWDFWKKTLNFWAEQSSLHMQALDLSCYSEVEFHPPLIWKYHEKPQFYNAWARQIMAINPSVTAEEGWSLMVRFLAGAQETLSCVSFWSSKCRKEVARVEKVKRSTMETIKGMDNGAVKKNWRNFSLGKEASVVTSPNYEKSGQKEDKGSFFHKDLHGEYQDDKRNHLDVRKQFF